MSRQSALHMDLFPSCYCSHFIHLSLSIHRSIHLGLSIHHPYLYIHQTIHVCPSPLFILSSTSSHSITHPCLSIIHLSIHIYLTYLSIFQSFASVHPSIHVYPLISIHHDVRLSFHPCIVIYLSIHPSSMSVHPFTIYQCLFYIYCIPVYPSIHPIKD